MNGTTKRIACAQLEEVVGRRCFVTCQRFGIPLLLAENEDAEKSLAIYTTGQNFKVDSNGKIIARNPLGFQKDGEITMRMNLGLTDEAEILWVKPLVKGALDAWDGEPITVEQLETPRIDELQSQDFAFGKMRGMISEVIGKASHWLVRQPLAPARNLNLKAVRRNAKGCWQTKEEIYFLVPVGYINIIEDFPEAMSAEERAVKIAEVYKENADDLLEPRLAALEAPKREEARQYRYQMDLPKFRNEAYSLAQRYTVLTQEAAPFFTCLEKKGETALCVRFDAEEDKLSFAGKCCSLSREILDECKALLEQLQQKVTDFENRSQRVEGFRVLLEDVTRNIAISDWYGELEYQVARRPVIFKTVEVELAEEYAYIVVLRGNEEKSRLRFGYDEAERFHTQLKKLGLVKDDVPTTTSGSKFLKILRLPDEDY